MHVVNWIHPSTLLPRQVSLIHHDSSAKWLINDNLPAVTSALRPLKQPLEHHSCAILSLEYDTFA